MFLNFNSLVVNFLGGGLVRCSNLRELSGVLDDRYAEPKFSKFGYFGTKFQKEVPLFLEMPESVA